MKKLQFVCLIAGLCLLSTAANSQVRIGASAGLNISGISGNDSDGTESRTGFRGGLTVDIPVADQFSLQPAAVISIQGWKNDGLDIKANYITIEAKAAYEVIDGLSLQAGPTVGFNVFAAVDGDEINNFESTDIGALVAAQYELPMGVFFQIQYALGFSDLIEGFDAKNRNFSASVGYFFN